MYYYYYIYIYTTLHRFIFMYFIYLCECRILGGVGVLSCFVIYICVHVEIPTSVYNLNALLVVAHEHVTNGK